MKITICTDCPFLNYDSEYEDYEHDCNKSYDYSCNLNYDILIFKKHYRIKAIPYSKVCQLIEIKLKDRTIKPKITSFTTLKNANSI